MDNGKFADIMFAKASEKGIPLSVTLELTKRCNFGCKMCYIHGGEKDAASELTCGEWIELAESAAEKGALYILLTGGEPMIRDDFCDIYRRLYGMGFIISVNTNGSLLSGESMEMFGELPPERVNISLYGASESTYRDMCGNAGAYRTVIENIMKLKEAGVNLRLNYTMTPRNVKDAEKIFAFAWENGIALRADAYTFPAVRRECTADSERFTPAEYAAARLKYDSFRFGGDNVIGQRERTEKPRESAEDERGCDEKSTGMSCRAGSCSCWITHDGKMLMCGLLPSVSVNAREEGFARAWEKIRAEREKITVPKKCAVCANRKICPSCPAVCAAETGKTDGVPEYCCRCTDEYAGLYGEARG